MAALWLLIPYAVLPIALAMLVRADWHMIGKAYAIWGVFLVLAFGSAVGGEGVGWALIIAIFYTTPVIPLLCLIMKIWIWARTRFTSNSLIG
jgi:hypothetical protein